MAEQDDREQRVFGRVLGRLIPFIFPCYVAACVDGVNIGFPAVDMQNIMATHDGGLALAARLHGIEVLGA